MVTSRLSAGHVLIVVGKPVATATIARLRIECHQRSGRIISRPHYAHTVIANMMSAISAGDYIGAFHLSMMLSLQATRPHLGHTLLQGMQHLAILTLLQSMLRGHTLLQSMQHLSIPTLLQSMLRRQHLDRPLGMRRRKSFNFGKHKEAAYWLYRRTHFSTLPLLTVAPLQGAKKISESSWKRWDKDFKTFQTGGDTNGTGGDTIDVIGPTATTGIGRSKQHHHSSDATERTHWWAYNDFVYWHRRQSTQMWERATATEHSEIWSRIKINHRYIL